jgi:hypothetical protein
LPEGKTMRIALFFLYAFGFMIGLPALVLFFVQRALGPLQYPPPPMPGVGWDPVWFETNQTFNEPQRLLAAKGPGPVVDLRQVIPYAEAAAAAVNGDGTLAAAARFATAEDADRGLARLAQQYGLQQQEKTADGWRVSASGMAGRVLRDERRFLLVIGTEEAVAVKRLAETPGLAMTASLASVAGAEKRPCKMQFIVVLAGVLGWAAAQFFIFGRVASWAGGVPAAPDVRPLSAGELKVRLMAVNAMGVPFTVSASRAPNELVVDWRYGDAAWFDLMRVHKMQRGYRLVLRLDGDAHNVRAMEQISSLDLSAGAAAASLDWKTSYGINFVHYQHERVFGLQIKDGNLTLDPSYAYTFDLREIKQPIIDVIRNAGWEFRPVITFFRPIGG